jgi:hypothetical protein
MAKPETVKVVVGVASGHYAAKPVGFDVPLWLLYSASVSPESSEMTVCILGQRLLKALNEFKDGLEEADDG